jgi:hypothetical protein
MIQEPYSIYIKKRPLRIAFLINPEKYVLSQIQKVIDFNLHLWGGRYNPIIFTDGKTVKNDWWTFLNAFDPDIILSLLPLEMDLIQKIDNFLSPISLKMPEQEIQNYEDYYIKCDYNGLSIKQSEYNLNELYHSKLVLLDTDGMEDIVLKQFIYINFSSFRNTISIYEMDKNRKNIIKISSRESLNDALLKISVNNNFVFPIQFCSIPHNLKGTKFEDTDQFFTVVIGDSPKDIVYNWNSILSLTRYSNRSLNSIWLPKEIASSKELEEGLYELFRNLSNRQSVSGVCRIKFISYSIDESELKEIAEKLTKNSISKIISTYEEIRLPQYKENSDFVSITSEMDSFQVTGDKVQIKLNPPKVEKGLMSGESWVADIYMQFRPERYPNIQGKTLWWKLPQHNRLAYDLFNSASRICSNGFPSVLLARELQNLQINLINDSEIFRFLLTDEDKPILKSDARGYLKHDNLAFIQPSNTGRYMSGFINLFKDLFIAKQYLEISYWRHMFDILSNVNPKKDKNKRKEIKNALRKKSEIFKKSKDSLNWLTDYVSKLSRDIVTLHNEITYNVFIEEAEKVCEKFNSIKDNEKLGYQKEEFISNMKETLAEFIKLGIIQVGIRPHCPSCGIGQWFHIDEIKQDIICKGCRVKFSIKPNENWFYKLNSLVHIGYSLQGLTPVILVLGQLLEESRTSFIYNTSLEIFKKGKSEPFTDLDIVCIQDGKLIIGEIKQSIDGFRNYDFITMKEMAEIIKPDIVIFSSLDKNCNKNIKEKIKKLNEDLETLKIEVKWYQLRKDNFESTPFL